jgi:hypothetical protein
MERRSRLISRLRWVACAAVAATMLSSAAVAGGVAWEWAQSIRVENADVDCSWHGGELSSGGLRCVHTASDGAVTEVPFPLSPSTSDAVVLISAVVVFVLAIEAGLLGFLRLVSRLRRRLPAIRAPARTPAS